ncbi:MAG: hypothetical protein Q9218_007599 [Villophora microphyllina]
MNRTVQHAIYDGSRGRYSDDLFELKIHDRPEFYGASHYDLRITLDREGMLEPFIIVDEKTPDLRRDPSHRQDPPITYPSEDFVLWQAHMLALDLPINAVSWDVGCGDLVETVDGNYSPYDPYDPQTKIISLGVNWTDPETATTFWGFASVTANGTEVEWSTSPEDRRHILPVPPVVGPAQRISPPDEEVSLVATYDWNSPIWPTGYPDDSAGVGALNTRHVRQARRPRNTRAGISLPT